MTLLNFRNVGLSLGHQPLLDGVDFQIERRERLCLIGRNGTGKTTLMKLAAGELQPDDGVVARAPEVRIARLEQEIPNDVDGNVMHVVASGLSEIGDLIERYQHLAHAVEAGDHREMKALERCQNELEAADGWDINARVERVLSRLQLDPEAEFTTLSGGLRRRVLLARALVSEPDLLLLDEPTNHLDIEAIEWIEDFLHGWDGALLFVTHDRAFLRRLATRIIELDRGHLVDFPGDYATYLDRKQAMLASEQAQDAQFDKKLKAEEAWIRQGIKARRTRNEGRVRALKKLREERAARRGLAGNARITIQAAERSGKIVVEAEDVAFRYADQTVVRRFSALVQRGDKIGLIGPNGAGKTTLLRLLTGELEPTDGEIRHGTKLEIAYFDQNRAALDPKKTVQEMIGEGKESVTIGGRDRHVLSYLQDFLFSPERARQPVKALSGGERNRLLLARLFTRPSNVLVLDEPTNDLDAETLELLEERLLEYEGTVLLVSHDRAFLDNVVTSTLVFEGGGIVNEYVGGYEDWLRQRSLVATKPSAKPTKDASVPANPARPKKLSYKEQVELKALPERIEALEVERDSLHEAMSRPESYQGGKNASVAAAQTRLAELEAELAAAYARWGVLET